MPWLVQQQGWLREQRAGQPQLAARPGWRCHHPQRSLRWKVLPIRGAVGLGNHPIVQREASHRRLTAVRLRIVDLLLGVLCVGTLGWATSARSSTRTKETADLHPRAPRQ